MAPRLGMNEQPSAQPTAAQPTEVLAGSIERDELDGGEMFFLG